MKGLWRAVALAMVCAVGAVPAGAGTGIWVQHFTVTGPEQAQVLSKGMADMLVTDLVGVIDKAPCAASVVERDRIDEIRQEQALQQTPGFDPSTAVPTGHLIEPSVAIRGSLTVQGDTYAYTADVVRLSDGKVLDHEEGSVPGDQVLAISEELASRLLKHVCPIPMRVQASYNDLQLDSVICGFDSEFALRGTGETSGIVFRMTPSGGPTQGEVAISGTAGGVPWGGAGVYAAAIDPEAGGTLAITGSWYLDSPVGRFGDEGTIEATVTPVPGATCAG